jgi:hypothetical protein
MKNNSGFTIIFVMALILVTSFISVAIIKMSHSSQISAIDYGASDEARTSVDAGFTVGITKLTGLDTGYVRELVQAWVNNKNPNDIPKEYVWLAGGPGTSEFDRLDKSQFYRTKIIGFDFNNRTIALQSEGRGYGNSKASAIGVYKLIGLDIDIPVSQLPTNALQMDNGAFEFNIDFEVFGNTSVKDSMAMNGNGKFHGIFRLDPIGTGTKAGGLNLTDDDNTVTFDSTTYFAGKFQSYSTSIFKRNVGFEKGINSNATNIFFTPGTKVFIRGGSDNNGSETVYDMKLANLTAFGAKANYKFGYQKTGYDFCFTNNGSDGYDGLKPEDTPKQNIPEAIGLPKDGSPKVFFNTSKLTINREVDASKCGKLTADDLNSWYSQYSTALQNGFMVIHIKNYSSSYGIFKNTASKFNGKAILLLDDGRSIEGEMIETSSTANLTIYVENNTINNNMFMLNKYFRGMLYVNKCSNNYFVFWYGNDPSGGNLDSDPNVPAIFDGIVYGSSQAKFKFDGNDGNTRFKRIVKFNQAVVDELAPLGIFSDPASSSSTTPTIKITKRNLSSQLLSRSY